MKERLPASLAYVLIYNPSLHPAASTLRDDEDAEEEAHILFYTSRERAASRDRMLRQVGLAKALVNFSQIFSLDQGCDNVHSQMKRMVHVSPEHNFWMHACVDLARTPKSNKGDAKVVNSGNTPGPQTYYHHEDSLHDLVLRGHLLKGYEAFKLIHGTFTFVLENRGPEGLRAQLEHFFTPWIWKWELEKPFDFSAHLGLPLHPYNSALAPLVTSFFMDVPSHARPLLVCPPYTIESTKLSPQYPPSLPVHLLSLVPRAGHPAPSHTSSRKPKSSRSMWSVATGSTNNTLGILSGPGVGMGDAINVKKWSWPVALTFSKHKPPPQRLDGTGPQEHQDAPKAYSSDQVAISLPSQDTSVGRIEVSSPDDPLLPDDQDVKESDVRASPTDVGLSSAVRDREPDETRNSMLHSERSLSQTPPNTFSVFKAFLSELSDPSIVQRRTVLYISMFQLVFAILMDIDWPEDKPDRSLDILERKVPGFLQDIRRVIDSQNARDSTATEMGKAPNPTKHVISLPHSIVSSRDGFSARSSQFFEGQEMLAKNSDTIEIFSRTATPQKWFVARRGLGINNAGDRIEGEAYLEANNKDGSLVDADNELVSAVRGWVDLGE